MISGTSHFMAEKGFKTIDEFVGLALPNMIPADNVDRDYKVVAKINDKKWHLRRRFLSSAATG
jgi:dihydropyrimidine dehydrogenase (NAD+) subunit PreA